MTRLQSMMRMWLRWFGSKPIPLHDTAHMVGEVTLEWESLDGTKRKEVTHNMVLRGGKAFIANLLANTPNYTVTHLQLGTGTTPVQESDGNLVACTVTKPITRTSIENDTVACITTFFNTTEANGTFNELGLVGASMYLLARTLKTFSKTNSENLTITWRIQVT